MALKYKLDLNKYFRTLDELSPVRARGRVSEIIGLIIKAEVPGVRMGELCLIKSHYHAKPLKAEVVGFQGNQVKLMPLGEVEGVGLDSEVIPTGHSLTVKVGESLLGRVLDGLGEPLDNDIHGEPQNLIEYPVYAPPPDPLKRRRVLKPLSVGIRAIDGLLTVGEGQRLGIFAAAGGGKSTLMGMIARNTEADINVIALIGERGREVRDFIEESLGEEGLKRSVVVVATSDKPSLVRLKSAYVATAIAEYFRDQGKKVILMMDSVTRFARAQREVGLAVGEPPARQGYTPSVFSTLPKLLERAGNSDKGSITAFYTVLVAGDDIEEPVADEVMSILDGHIILSRELAARNHYPAIDISVSKSRVMDAIIDERHKKAAAKLREAWAIYEKEAKDLINIGEYKKGRNPKLDWAVEKIEAIRNFLKQGIYEKVTFQEAVEQMIKIMEV